MVLGYDTLRRARRRLLEMHYRARVGHLGGNLSCIDAMMLVHHEMMQSEDRFVLSKGHSAGALYVTLWKFWAACRKEISIVFIVMTLCWEAIRRRKAFREFYLRQAVWVMAYR